MFFVRFSCLCHSPCIQYFEEKRSQNREAPGNVSISVTFEPMLYCGVCFLPEQ